MKGRREIHERLVIGFLFAQQVPLDLDAHVPCAKRADDAIDEAALERTRAAGTPMVMDTCPAIEWRRR